VALAGLGMSAAPAFAQAPWWRLGSTAAPTDLPLQGEGQLVVTASNVGDGAVNAAGEHVSFTDELPVGVKPESVEGFVSRGIPGGLSGCEVLGQAVTCRFASSIPPYERLVMRITVKTDFAVEPAPGSLANTVKVEGGKTLPVTLDKPLTVDGAQTPFGVEAYELTPEGEGGSFDTQAGSHPFQLTTTLDFNQTLAFYTSEGEQSAGFYPSAPALPRDLHFKLPAGLVGDPSAVPACSDVEFSTTLDEGVSLCPASTAVGVATVLVNDPTPLGFTSFAVPVFNLEAAYGEPARFGFDIRGVPVVLKTSLPAGGEYPVEVSINEASQAVQVLSSQVTLWGVPGDPRHDSSRGWECLGDGTWETNKEHPPACIPEREQNPTAFLTLPTSCTAAPTTSMTGDSWPIDAKQPGSTIEENEHTRYTFPSALTGCGLLAFEPSISVAPEVHAASTPMGLTVKVTVPQASLLSAEGLAEADVKDTTVTLPEGIQASPGAANGLGACSATGMESIGLEEGFPEASQLENDHFFPGPSSCPQAAKIGTLTIKTPLLANTLTGGVYLAKQDTNLIEEKLVLYLTAEDPVSGVRIKLAGEVHVDPTTGRLTSTFTHTPPLPFSELTLNLFGEARAPQSTPALCGAYTSTASFTSWSGSPPANRSTNPKEFGSLVMDVGEVRVGV
jgi:hypothetical protein